MSARSHTRLRNARRKATMRRRWRAWKKKARVARRKGWALPKPPERDHYRAKERLDTPT